MMLVTGANGFLGRTLMKALNERDIIAIGAVRNISCPQGIVVGEIGPDTNWNPVLDKVDTVIHTAARVHALDVHSNESMGSYHKINVAGTCRLAEQAVQSGVRRFIFISSIKVNGEETARGRPYSVNDIPSPVDPYGISKYEAEMKLLRLAEETGLEVVIIRPVLVYGPGVKANFLNMMRWLNKSIPLPLGMIHNKRSLVALDNLVDLIITCIDHPAAAKQIFLVSDDEDLSTTELLQRMAAALGKSARLLPVPEGLLRVGATLLGKREMARRLLGSLQVDIRHTKEVLGWRPPVSVSEALKKTAEEFLAHQITHA